MYCWKCGYPYDEKAFSNCPSCNSPSSSTLTPSSAPSLEISVVRDGPIWEKRSEFGWFSTLVQSTKKILFHPTQSFKTMKCEGDFYSPLIYLSILGTMGMSASFFYQILINAITGKQDFIYILIAAAIVFPFCLIFFPIILIIGALLGAAVTHASLWFIAGIEKPYETTLRVYCYSSGSTAILNLIPICGSIIIGIWGLILNFIGLSEAHEISKWRTFFALLLPFLFCCFLIVLFFLLIFFFVGALPNIQHYFSHLNILPL